MLQFFSVDHDELQYEIKRLLVLWSHRSYASYFTSCIVCEHKYFSSLSITFSGHFDLTFFIYQSIFGRFP